MEPKADRYALNGVLERDLYLTTTEAVALVKRSERERAEWALLVGFSAYLPNNPEQHYPYGCTTYLSLSRADALHIVQRCLSPTLEEKGARIKVVRRVSGERVTYWLG